MKPDFNTLLIIAGFVALYFIIKSGEEEPKQITPIDVTIQQLTDSINKLNYDLENFNILDIYNHNTRDSLRSIHNPR